MVNYSGHTSRLRNLLFASSGLVDCPRYATVFAYYKYEHHLAELVASKLSEEAFSSTRVSDGSSETYEACRFESPQAYY
jgi:hypothetical protein